MMAIENIITMVLINGLPDEFKYMKDLMFSKDLMGEFPDFKETLQAMMTYDLNKQKVDDVSTIVVPPGPTILSANSTVGLKAECGICHKEFNATLRKSDGKRNPNCYPCNSYLTFLHNYSLTATATISSVFGMSDIPTNIPWQLDSGATFSSTNVFSDLLQPSRLLAPIPIKGADGTIIFVTHVESSHLDPRHPVYFVPRSDVKLVSLGVLTALGYTVHTDKTRSIVVADLTGTILCSCPI